MYNVLCWFPYGTYLNINVIKSVGSPPLNPLTYVSLGTINYTGFSLVFSEVFRLSSDLHISTLILQKTRWVGIRIFSGLPRGTYLDLLWRSLERNVTGYTQESFSTVIHSAMKIFCFEFFKFLFVHLIKDTFLYRYIWKSDLKNKINNFYVTLGNVSLQILGLF